ncbi:glycosyltransferase family 4 protein [Bradyrhizobium sp. UNPF46]|uniref:glycosyltransferase family 4 protein n=1 Tax=Bradyrhizobium sp. UNPF46 TaxID=1141168 RepID=UPI00114F2680|nr:glycosyltransferase family 4 protein [Bradyrhizobium sp. UNPF46]
MFALASNSLENSMKIAIFSSSFSPAVGGMETLSETLAVEFVRAGHGVKLITDTAGEEGDRYPFPVLRQITSGRRFSIYRQSDVILSLPLSLRRVTEQLLSHRPIVVHHPNPLVGRNGRPGLNHLVKQIIRRRMINVVPGQYMARSIQRSIIIPNPYNHHLFEYHGEDKPGDVLFVGRLATVKGVDTLLRAIRKALEAVPNFRTTIVGEGPERERFLSLSQQLQLGNFVTFVGAMRGQELASTMRQHRVMVVPSLYQEPFGIVALEGLASGCLMIVSQRGGLVDAVGPHALTFENGNAEQLADRLIRALRDPGLTETLLKGSQHHLHLHRADTIAARYLEAMKSTATNTANSLQ